LTKNNCSITFIIISALILCLPEQSNSQGKKPSFQDGVIYLSLFIADGNFIQEKQDDLEIVNEIFNHAVEFYQGDISEALLALTFATLPFNKMVINLPILNVNIPLNLPSVNEWLFLKKKKNIPGNIYFDSKLNGGQDKDKLPHFFGNAFLAYNISAINASKFLGLFVEMFESAFKVSGVDYRDIQTNHLGEFFGYSLKENPKHLPSHFLKVYSLFYFSYN